MKRALRSLALASLGIASCAVVPLQASAAPVDTVLAAFAAEDKAPLERVRLFVERDKTADVYYIDRIRPNRLHMVKNPRQGGLEVIVIDGSEWLRDTSGWQKSPAGASNIVPSMAGLFRAGLTSASERPAPSGGRAIEGKLSWSNGAACEGKVLMQIAASGRPRLLRFEGACDGRPSRFREAFSFDGPLTIVQPK